MNKIFWGLIFIFVHINIGAMDILPNFIGYLLISSGMQEVGESPAFASRALVNGTAVYSCVVWIMTLLGAAQGVLGFLLGLVTLVLQLMVTYRIVLGVEELEPALECDLGSGALRSGWTVMAVGSAVGYALFMIVPALVILALIVSFVAMIYYIIRFYQSKEAYLASGRHGSSDT